MGLRGRTTTLPRRAARKLRATLEHSQSPFRKDAGSPLIVHCSHHKSGTVWISRVLHGVATRYGLQVTEPAAGEPFTDGDIALITTGDFDTHLPAGVIIPIGRQFVGSHMIRDPRDIVVSGYFYHQRAREDWLQIPLERFGGLTYQQHLLSVDRKQGLMTEIFKVATWDIPSMVAWDYNRAEFVELRYEDAMADEQSALRRLFLHYEFNDRAVNAGLQIVERMRRAHATEVASYGTAAAGHARSGQPGEWRDYLDDDHIDFFKASTGDALLRLGYETSPDWRQ